MIYDIDSAPIQVKHPKEPNLILFEGDWYYTALSLQFDWEEEREAYLEDHDNTNPSMDCMIMYSDKIYRPRTYDVCNNSEIIRKVSELWVQDHEEYEEEDLPEIELFVWQIKEWESKPILPELLLDNNLKTLCCTFCTLLGQKINQGRGYNQNCTRDLSYLVETARTVKDLVSVFQLPWSNWGSGYEDIEKARKLLEEIKQEVLFQHQKQKDLLVWKIAQLPHS